MIRKKTAFILVLLANIVLLVYAVVPHHHHHEQICIENSHCQNDESTHKHDTPGHEHDGSRGTDCCVLKQALIIPPNSLRQEINCLVADDKHAPLWDYSAQLVCNDPVSLAPYTTSKSQLYPGTCANSIFLFSSPGLRAPPTV